MKTLIALILFILGCLAAGYYSTHQKIAPSSEVNSEFQCEGKIYCSEMTSCKEAQFYMNHCPNTKLNGDGDRVPCEKEWCGHSISKENHF